MENMITVFENEEFGAVRTATINGEPWFVANDVFRVLSVRNTKDALHTLDEDEKSGVDIIDPHGRIQRTNCISESGLYSIVLRSRKPEAKAFRRWITHEVIPAIRKHGMYATTPMLRQFQENPELIRLVCERMLAEKDRADKLGEKLAEIKPKADFFDAFVNPDDCTNIRTTAKELGIPERAFCRFLQDAESAAKTAEKTSKTASTAAEKVVEFLKEHKKGVAIALGIVMVLLIFTSFTSSCSVMIEGLLGSLSATTYPSEPEDMLAVEAEYCRMEDELREKLTSYAEKFPGYDEYRISGEVLGHDPYVLASALSAILGEYTLSDAGAMLDEIFDLQYLVEEKSITETRYRTETRTGYREVTDPETNETILVEYTYEVEVAYDYKICVVKLISKPLESVIDELLTDEQRQIYEILMKTKGNYPDLFN